MDTHLAIKYEEDVSRDVQSIKDNRRSSTSGICNGAVNQLADATQKKKGCGI